MTAQQAQQWELFSMLDPFPEDKIINTITHIAAVFANAVMPKKDKTSWRMDEFKIKYFHEPVKEKPQSQGQIKNALFAIADAFGATSKEEKERRKQEREKNKFRIKYEAEKYIPRRIKPPANPVKRRGK